MQKTLLVFRVALVAFLFFGWCALPAYAEEGADILKATGFQGGLGVHLGCGDGALTAMLARRDGVWVQGLDRSHANVAAARRHAQALGLYGNKVAISLWKGDRLPFVDNLVNLLVVEGDGAVSRREILRVLSPQGVACFRKDGQIVTLIKPRPKAMDRWTHYMYDATGNAVSHDRLVAPPEHLQWVGGPRWGRHHDHMASTSAMVTDGRRVYYIFDEGSTASIMLPARWHLIARDAFSGVVLWKRAIPRWWTRFTPLKSGPAQLPRLLVAGAGHVYVTLGLRQPVSQLDSATGKTVKTYAGTENTWEILLDEATGGKAGTLYAVTGSPRLKEEQVDGSLYPKRAPGNPINKLWKGWDRKLFAMNTRSGDRCWAFDSKILPGTLAVYDDGVFFHDSRCIVALDKVSGEVRWRSEPIGAIDIEKGIPTGFMPSLAIDNGIIVFAGGRGYGQHMHGKTDKMVALRATDGKIIWKADHYTSGYQSPEDLLIANKVVLAPFTTWLQNKGPETNFLAGTDLMTGAQVHHKKPDVKDPVWFIHHRCYPSRATVDYLLTSKEGVEFVDLKTWHWKIHHWFRGECLYGIMPANGMVYAPMHECACSADMKLNGLNAVVAPKARMPNKLDVKKSSLTKGPAYGKVDEVGGGASEDWPTYRHDAVRSGVASCSVSNAIARQWSVDLKGKLTAPVVAAGRLFVASIHGHTLYALDAGTGKEAWTFTTEGRIDSPPTIYKGMVLMGCRDGCVYCLHASDGALAWRFRAVSEDRRLMAWEQMESVWPIHGSILIRQGEAWFVAGRSSFLDGGLQMFRLNPDTGQVISRATLDGKWDDGRVLTGAQEKRLVGLPDVLSATRDGVFMRAGFFALEGDKIKRKLLPPSKVIRYGGSGPRLPAGEKDIPGVARPHLFSSYGFLDDTWFHRTYWTYSEFYTGRHAYAGTGKNNPAGRILVCDDRIIYGFGRKRQYFNWTSPMEYRLFAEAKKKRLVAAGKKGAGAKKRAVVNVIWEADVPILVRGLVLAGDNLFAAGCPDVLDETRQDIRAESAEVLKAISEQEAALAGKRGGLLLAVGKGNGKVLRQVAIDAPPVFDGMIAANGRLYLALENGQVQCWSP